MHYVYRCREDAEEKEVIHGMDANPVVLCAHGHPMHRKPVNRNSFYRQPFGVLADRLEDKWRAYKSGRLAEWEARNG